VESSFAGNTMSVPPLRIPSVQVSGGNPVSGCVAVSGSKIAAIPIIAAAILIEEPVEVVNLPQLEDVRVLLQLIQLMGGSVSITGNATRICTANINRQTDFPPQLIASVHGSIYLLPALLARLGYVRIPSTYGGCQIGARPVTHILRVLEMFGATVSFEDNYIVCTAKRLRGTALSARFSSRWDKFRSGATKAAIIAAVVADGTTVIDSAYHRSSITELVCFLRMAGADIIGESTQRIVINGGKKLFGGTYTLSGDYLEAVTLMGLAGTCGGTIEIQGFNPADCQSELALLERIGLLINRTQQGIEVSRQSSLKACHFSTAEIDTDLQPIFGAILATACGESHILENVWENRFMYAMEMNKMKAYTVVSGDDTLIVRGVHRLEGSEVNGTDVRGVAALLLAAAGARGDSTIRGFGHIARGYERLIEKAHSLGVRIAPTNSAPTAGG
jgi:UDP-N-acetylglucosamine 1-carboxyvinyltransferase